MEQRMALQARQESTLWQPAFGLVRVALRFYVGSHEYQMLPERWQLRLRGLLSPTGNPSPPQVCWALGLLRPWAYANGFQLPTEEEVYG